MYAQKLLSAFHRVKTVSQGLESNNSRARYRYDTKTSQSPKILALFHEAEIHGETSEGRILVGSDSMIFPNWKYDEVNEIEYIHSVSYRWLVVLEDIPAAR